MSYKEMMKNAGAEELSERVAVYVPGTVDVKKSVDSAEKVEQTAAKMASLFGGASAHTVRGYWISEAGELVKEQTTIVYSNTTPAGLREHLPAVIGYARQMREEMRQEAVSLEVNGSLYFVRG